MGVRSPHTPYVTGAKGRTRGSPRRRTEEVEGGGNFTKEDDYRGTRGERGDAVKRRFCHSLVQPSISGACLSRVCVCVCVCVCRVSKFLGKSIPIRVFLFEIGEK